MARVNQRVGLDFGASLVKIARENGRGAVDYQLLPRSHAEAVLEELTRSGVARVGVTGAGAGRWRLSLATAGVDARAVDEFSAWARGAEDLLAEQGSERRSPYLLVSIGTGTSVVRVRPDSVHRAGGTALGGGTLLGLARGLLGSTDFAAIVALAAAGNREEVDLRLADLYPDGGIPLPPEATASNFGKLAARLEDGDPPAPEHLARGLMGLVGENIGLLCAGLARAEQLDQLVFGGATLRANPTLRSILARVAQAFGLRAVFLERGEFTGARGALELAK